MRLQGGRVSFAPDPTSYRTLDIGCGTGVVSFYLASKFPNNVIYALDPRPPLFFDPRMGSNVISVCGLMPGIALKDTTHIFKPGTFGLCFSRLVLQGIQDWPSHIKTVASLLAPWGYLEIQEPAWEYYSDHHLGVGNDPRVDHDWGWLKAVKAEAKRQGLDFDCGKHIAGWMQNAGLEVVVYKRFKWPFGTWLADSGQDRTRAWGEYWAKSGVDVTIDIFERLFPASKGIDHEKYTKYKEEIRATMGPEDGKYLIGYVVVGRKPATLSPLGSSGSMG